MEWQDFGSLCIALYLTEELLQSPPLVTRSHKLRRAIKYINDWKILLDVSELAVKFPLARR